MSGFKLRAFIMRENQRHMARQRNQYLSNAVHATRRQVYWSDQRGRSGRTQSLRCQSCRRFARTLKHITKRRIRRALEVVSIGRLRSRKIRPEEARRARVILVFADGAWYSLRLG